MAHEFKKGDRFKVTLEGEVSGISGRDIWVRLDGHGDFENYFRHTYLNEHFTFVPKPLAVGDTVTWGLGARNFKIHALTGKVAFLCDNSTGASDISDIAVRLISELRRV